jgi:phosphotransferase system  glucose/maltose/N-acetylglucosamine-specific IIC component
MAPDAPLDVSAATVEQLRVAYDRADTEVRHHDGLLAGAALVFAVVLAAFGGSIQIERLFRLNSGFTLLTGGLAFATVGLVVAAVARRRVAAAERRRRIAERLAAATATAVGIDTDPGVVVTHADHEEGVDGGQTAGSDPETHDYEPEPTASDARREFVDTEPDGSDVETAGGSLDDATAVAGVIVTVGAALVALSVVVFAAWLNRLIPVYVPSSDQEFWLAVAIATVCFLVSVVALATLVVAGVDLATDEGELTTGDTTDAVDSPSTERGSR